VHSLLSDKTLLHFCVSGTVLDKAVKIYRHKRELEYTINPNPTTEMNRKINFSKVNLEVFLLYPMELRFVEVEGNVILNYSKIPGI
jgi:hypothetical protein